MSEADTLKSPYADPRITTKAQNAFGLRLLRELTAHAPRQNVFLSPTSVFMALLLAELGASGETGRAIRQALQVPPDVSSASLGRSAAAHASQLRAHQSVLLAVATSLWTDKRLPLDPNFIAMAREVCQGKADTLDFSDPAAAETVNSWVRKATGNLLDGIVTSDALAGSKCLLACAVYFAGKWQDPFDAELTRTGPFYLWDGAEKELSFMSSPGHRGIYRRGSRYEGAVMRYCMGPGGMGVEFGILLPERGTGPEEVLANLDAGTLFEQHHYVDLDLRMPKFSVRFSANLRTALERMGMERAFRYPEADFELMGSPEFVLDGVVHQSRLELDEEGTVAAAETISHVPVGAGRPREYEQRELVIDRPFAVLLRDSNDTILFVGVVYDPQPLEVSQKSAGGFPTDRSDGEGGDLHRADEAVGLHDTSGFDFGVYGGEAVVQGGSDSDGESILARFQRWAKVTFGA